MYLEWNIKHPGNKLVYFFVHVSVHQYIQYPGLGSILIRKLNSSLVVAQPKSQDHYLEGAACHNPHCEHLGATSGHKKGDGAL